MTATQRNLRLMTRKDDCRDQMLIAMARAIEILLHRSLVHSPVSTALELARLEGELKGCREIFEKYQ